MTRDTSMAGDGSGTNDSEDLSRRALMILFKGHVYKALVVLLFMSPIVGPALSEARITGYDRAGHVCPKLTKMQLRNKYNFEMKHHVGTFKTASPEKLAEMH